MDDSNSINVALNSNYGQSQTWYQPQTDTREQLFQRNGYFKK